MKRILFYVFLCSYLAIPTAVASETIFSGILVTDLNKTQPSNPPQTPYEPKIPTNKHRCPPYAYISCTISSENGVQVSGIDNEDIIAYNIYAEDGNLIFSCSTDQELIGFLVHNYNDVELEVVLPAYSLHGWIYVNQE